jgi:hypothetical protein
VCRATVSLASMDRAHGDTGKRIVVASWIGDGVFLAASLPAVFGVSGAEGVAAAVCLALFALSLGVWGWAFAVAVARSSQGDDIAVGSLFLVEGSVAKSDRRALYLPFGASLVITAVAAASNPFAVLVPMLPLGFVGLWGARHGVFPRRKDVAAPARPLRPTHATRQRGGSEGRADGRARQ